MSLRNNCAKTVALLLSLILMSLSSCTLILYDKPYGKWKCHDPDITLYIGNINQDSAFYLWQYHGNDRNFDIKELVKKTKYTGTYSKDGDVRDVFVQFRNSPSFIISDINAYYYDECNNSWLSRGDMFYFIGKFKLKRDGKLYYYVHVSSDGSRDSKPVYEKKIIVFELLEKLEDRK